LAGIAIPAPLVLEPSRFRGETGRRTCFFEGGRPNARRTLVRRLHSRERPRPSPLGGSVLGVELLRELVPVRRRRRRLSRDEFPSRSSSFAPERLAPRVKEAAPIARYAS